MEIDCRLLEILHNNKQLMSKTVSATSNDVTTQVHVVDNGLLACIKN